MEHRTNRTPGTVTWRSAPRVRARACVVSLAPVLALLVALTAGGLGAAHIAPRPGGARGRWRHYQRAAR